MLVLKKIQHLMTDTEMQFCSHAPVCLVQETFNQPLEKLFPQLRPQ